MGRQKKYKKKKNNKPVESNFDRVAKIEKKAVKPGHFFVFALHNWITG